MFRLRSEDEWEPEHESVDLEYLLPLDLACEPQGQQSCYQRQSISGQILLPAQCFLPRKIHFVEPCQSCKQAGRYNSFLPVPPHSIM